MTKREQFIPARDQMYARLCALIAFSTSLGGHHNRNHTNHSKMGRHWQSEGISISFGTLT